ncbi:MAG TPA: HupE/UreJ family protein [Puia sp.]|uniref:HupE/UreJ family protein n=1 Tax=Puia sp. TaxID=2045100 RepID=UPI002CD949C2|nr:HupE/UreJ family protein [Puia sp.]HVU95913.1 HupE/UreJ family protein [Puia sp.]
MGEFNIYFGLGTHHILNLDAKDHLLFVAALCLRYQLKDWKKVAVLVTAFTIGHSITLALTATGAVHINKTWIEFLIPVTIIVTAFNNLLQRREQVEHPSRLPLIYFFALFFGLIHGMAFGSDLRSLMTREEVIIPLLAFNLGIEAAQLLVVALFLLISFIFVQLLRAPRIGWMRIASVIILLWSMQMAWERWPTHH